MHSQPLKDSWSKCWMLYRGKPPCSAQMTQSAMPKSFSDKLTLHCCFQDAPSGRTKTESKRVPLVPEACYLPWSRGQQWKASPLIQWISQSCVTVQHLWHRSKSTERSLAFVPSTAVPLENWLTSPSRYTNWLGQAASWYKLKHATMFYLPIIA